MKPKEPHGQTKHPMQTPKKSSLPVWVQMQQDDNNLINFSPDDECVSEFLAQFRKVETMRVYAEKAKCQASVATKTDTNTTATTNKNEEWHSIDLKDFPQYVINRMGHIKNIGTNRILPSCIKEIPNTSQRRVTLTNSKGREKTFRLHILVAQVFVPNPNPPQWDSIYHIDNKRSNCRADNLFWGPQNATLSNLTIAANNAAAAEPCVSRYSKYRGNCGLIDPYTWSLRIKAPHFNDWRPYLTIFHPADLFSDFGLLKPQPPSQQASSQQYHFAPSYDYAKDTIECTPIFKNQELSWQSWNGGNGQYCPVLVSIHGVIWDREQRLIGPGLVSIKHQSRKVYRPHFSEPWLQERPTPATPTYHTVDTMVLEAWLGDTYWQHFLGRDCNPERGIQVYHVDGNIHHNHLFNLLVVPDTIASDKDDALQRELLRAILDRIEPIWQHIEATGANSIPGITSTYARTVISTNHSSN